MLELKNISKIFPGVQALKDVSLVFKEGEIHGLMGENGAGKSTLIKIICGITSADIGSIHLYNKRVNFKSFRDAVDHRLNIVNQEIQVVPECTVAEAVCLDRIEKFKKNGAIQWKAMHSTTKEYLHKVGIDIQTTEKVGKLDVAQKQLIQITKAISSNSKFLLFDEPTSSLTKHEAERLVNIIHDLKANGVGIIFVSHKIEEVLALCDKVSVLRDGNLITTLEKHEMTRENIVNAMIGRAELLSHRGFLDIKNEKVLEVCNVCEYGRFKDISFCLKKGEILGLYGLVGSGRTELMRLLIGERKLDSGNIYVNGKKVLIKSISDALEYYKIGYVTENRKEEGLILEASINDNISITIWERLTNIVRKINRKKESKAVIDIIDKLNIICTSKEASVKNLSGGNQQKVSIAKWLVADCDILIIDEPTVGVDIGAKEYIHKLIWELAKKEGKSIILISSDLPELISLSRRILVMMNNKICGEVNGLNENVYSYDQVSSMVGKYLI